MVSNDFGAVGGGVTIQSGAKGRGIEVEMVEGWANKRSEGDSEILEERWRKIERRRREAG